MPHKTLKLGFALTLVCCLSLAGCSSLDAPAQLAGIWESDGYGHILVVTGKKIEVYDHAGNTCVNVPGASKEMRSILASSEFEFLNAANVLHITLPNEPYKQHFNRLSQLPTACVTPTSNTPTNNFEAFTNYFAQHYAFFDLFGVDWQQRVSAARAKISDQTSDTELFNLFKHLVEPLQDAHINLYATLDGKETAYGPEQSPMRAALDARAAAEQVSVEALQQALLTSLWEGNIATQLLRGEGTVAAAGAIQYGIIPAATGDNLGYLAIMRESGYSRLGSDDMATLNKILDAAIVQWQQANAVGVVIDIAVNFGGSDYIGRAIASRFAANRTLAYRKRAADRDQSTNNFDLYVEPYPGLQFTGPVTLVTSATTVSAGEILTMSLRSLPNVLHIGEPTRGSLSDLLDKTLPNGWTITLSNEIYTDHQGKLWEGPGIKPHRQITVLDPQDPITSHLQAIRTAVALTAKPTPKE